MKYAIFLAVAVLASPHLTLAKAVSHPALCTPIQSMKNYAKCTNKTLDAFCQELPKACGDIATKADLVAGALDFSRAMFIKYELSYTGLLPEGPYNNIPKLGNQTCTIGQHWPEPWPAGWPTIQLNGPRCYLFNDAFNVTKIYMFASYFCPQGYVALQSSCRIGAPGAPSVLGLVVSGTASWPEKGDGTTTGALAVCAYFFQPEAEPGRVANFDVTCVPVGPVGMAATAAARAALTPEEHDKLALDVLSGTGDVFGKD